MGSQIVSICTSTATVFHIVTKSTFNILIIKLRILYPKYIANQSMKRETNATAVPLTQLVTT
jgi:hypothetical protein